MKAIWARGGQACRQGFGESKGGLVNFENEFLSQPTLTPAHALELVKYHTKRNHIVYRSHRKRRLVLLTGAMKDL